MLWLAKSALITLGLATAPPSPSVDKHPDKSCPDCAPQQKAAKTTPLSKCPSFILSKSPQSRPQIQLDLYFDPLSRNLFPLWVEVERLLAERPGELLVRWIPIRRYANYRNANEDRVRYWFLASTTAFPVRELLRTLDRYGWRWISSRLQVLEYKGSWQNDFLVDRHPEAEHLNFWSELPPTQLQCLAQSFESNVQRYRKNSRHYRGTLPFVHIRMAGHRERRLTTNAVLRELRNAIDELQSQAPLRGHSNEQASTMIPKPRPFTLPKQSEKKTDKKKATDSDKRFAFLDSMPTQKQLVLGDVGAKHHLEIVRSDADIGTAIEFRSILESALDIRELNPRELSIALDFRGESKTSQLLRQELCLARKNGTQLQFLRRVAQVDGFPQAPAPQKSKNDQDPQNRPLPSSETPSKCDSDASSQQKDSKARRSAGVWLDRRPANLKDLEQLRISIAFSQEKNRDDHAPLRSSTKTPVSILDWWLVPSQ